MSLVLRAFAVVMGGLLVACQSTVNPSTPDTTPPATNLLIKRAGAADLEVQNRSGPSANKADLVPFPASRKFDFSVLETATDPQSGIREVKLNMTRMVCFKSSSGGIAQAYSGTVTRKQANYPDPKQVPSQASLGDTGVVDNTPFAIANPSADNLLVWVNANQVSAVGVGVLTRWSMEAKNAAGLTSYSDAITIGAGDTSCGPLP